MHKAFQTYIHARRFPNTIPYVRIHPKCRRVSLSTCFFLNANFSIFQETKRCSYFDNRTKCSFGLDWEHYVPYNIRIQIGGYFCKRVLYDKFAKFARHCMKLQSKENFYGTLQFGRRRSRFVQRRCRFQRKNAKYADNFDEQEFGFYRRSKKKYLHTTKSKRKYIP